MQAGLDPDGGDGEPPAAAGPSSGAAAAGPSKPMVTGAGVQLTADDAALLDDEDDDVDLDALEAQLHGASVSS